MMVDSSQQNLVVRLAEARLGSRTVEMEELRVPLDDAQSLQVAVLETLEASGQMVSGWKVGLTSGPAYNLMGAGVRPFGYILDEKTFRSGARIEPPAGAALLIEPELCLELDKPLSGPALTRDDCLAAVCGVKAAFEVNQSRVRMPNRNHLFVADGLSNWGLVVGSGKAPEEVDGLPLVELFRDGKRIKSSELDIRMDDPFESLATLCARLAPYGRGIAAGQHVITGAFFRHAINAPGEYRAVFSGLGEVSFNIG